MHSRSRSLVLLGMLGAVSLACSDGVTAPRPLDDIRVSASSVIVAVGDTLRLTATVRTADGSLVANAPVDWSTLDPAIATVTGQGLVRGVSEGTARILARSSGAVDTFRVAVGGNLSFNVNSSSSCTDPALRNARVVAVSEHAIIAEDVNNPPGGFSGADYRFIATTFDTLVYPVVTNAFGTPQDIDNNRRVVILYSRAVNELTARGSSSFVGGFFFSRDLFPKIARPGFQACASSNEAELFYMLVPDPEGQVNGNRRSRDFVYDRTIATIGHEFQHLINASRRLYVNNAPTLEALWLNEGLSHIAEELLFYGASGLTPKQNIGIPTLRQFGNGVEAFNRYAINNFGRFANYIEAPQDESPYGSGDGLATRGAAWNFLRYSADRSPLAETTIWRALVNAREAGFANLDQVLGTNTRRWVGDWSVAHATNRFGVTAPPLYSHLSWNVNNIMTELRLPTLAVRSLAPDVTERFTIVAGGTGYVRVRATAGSPLGVRVATGTTADAPSCAGQPTRTLAIGQVVQGTLAEFGTTCFEVTSTPTEYVIATSNLAATVSAQADVAVRVLGNASIPTAMVAGASGPTLQRSRDLLAASGAGFESNFEMELRQLEQRELEPRLVGRGGRRLGAPSYQVSGGVGSDIVVSVLRIQ